MLDKIRQKLMVRANQKRDGGQQAMWEITPVVVGKLEVEKKYARYCNAYQSGVGLWEILGSERQYEVNLFSRTCGCNKWQLTGIPCKHAVTAIFAAKERPEDYVDEYFRKEAYLEHIAIIYPSQESMIGQQLIHLTLILLSSQSNQEDQRRVGGGVKMKLPR